MLVSLPWYDLPEIRPATDAFWRCLAARLREMGFAGVPEHLDRGTAYERQWVSPDFLFGQACGYDVLVAYATHLRIVATPCYSAAGCAGSRYSSFVVVRDDSPAEGLEELRGARCVINTPTSHSGMNTLRALVAPLHCRGRFFRHVTWSGSHETSLSMVARGEADVAAIDCVTYALLERHRRRWLRGTRVLCCTEQVPAPPLVTGAATSDEQVTLLRAALADVLESRETAAAREQLLLEGIELLPLDAYSPIAELERSALAQGYREIIDEPAPRRALVAGCFA